MKGEAMESFVTARVPAEIKEQGNAILREIGATPTELVNSAYAYVMREKRLPVPTKPFPTGKRVLSPEQKEKVRRLIEQTTFDVPEEEWAGRTYKEIIAEGKAADYEALS